MRLPGTARVGMLALCLGIVIFGVVHNWVISRTLILLDIPVTLAPGHIRTGDLKINVEAYFSVQIRFPYGGGQGCGEGSGLRTRRLAAIGEQVIPVPDTGGTKDSGVTHGTYLGSFSSKPGHYNLDIEVLSATQYLDSCQPRLQIEASYYDFNQWESIESFTFSFCVFCELLGVVLLLVFATTHFRKGSFEELRLRIFATDGPTGPAPPADLKPRCSVPLLLIFGIFGVATGAVVFVATIHWYDTRAFVVVDKPVSLGPGHIKTGEFTTHLKGTYEIAINTQMPYIDGCLEYAVLKTRWVVTRDGRVVAHRERGWYDWQEAIEGTSLFGFDAEPGTYNLDVEQLADGRCLDLGKPRLRVFLSAWDRASYDDLNAKLQLLSFLSLGTGLAFLFAHRSAWLRQKPRALPLPPSLPEQKLTWGITRLRYRRFPVRRGWAMNPVTNLPTIALVCVLTWFTWLIPTWIVYSGGQRTSHGLLVSLPRKAVPTVTSASGLTAPLVQIDAKGQLYLNYKQTTWKELPSSLDLALYGVPVRVVYLEGDNNILFMDAVRAIDIIQGLNAKAILLTPGSKAEN